MTLPVCLLTSLATRAIRSESLDVGPVFLAVEGRTWCAELRDGRVYADCAARVLAEHDPARPALADAIRPVADRELSPAALMAIVVARRAVGARRMAVA